MRRAVLLAALIVVVIAGAAILRLVDLGNRPMHCDEAVHAIKFGQLLEQDDYVYNPREYHGPSLNFLTLPIARLASARKLTRITEVHLRLLPALFGIALVGLVWLLRDELGYLAVFCAAVLTAVSPAMVFYSRYYIQEMLLVCFTFVAMVALWRYARGGTGVSPVHGQDARATPAWQPWAWLVVLGVSIGMMHASKETCVIALFAMALAATLTIRGKKGTGTFCLKGPWGASHSGPGKKGTGTFCLKGPWGASHKMSLSPFSLAPFLVLVLGAAGVSALFFSSFLDHPRGVVDSYTTYFHYLGRASGEGTAGRHYYPWYDYLHKLFWWRGHNGSLWTEAPIAALALVGMAAGVTRRGLRPASLPIVRFLSIYTVVMIVVYSAMPYKTPWCALGFLHGMILLAGVGAAILLRAVPGYPLKAVVAVLLVAATAYLVWQAHRASFTACADADNPYVYAHTTHDVPLLARRVEQIAAVHPDGMAMHVQVICPDDDHWPLPWYLRGFSRVDWYPGIPSGRAAPLIITQPVFDEAVLDYVYVQQPPGQRPLRDLLRQETGEDWHLRPHVPLLVVVRYDLLQAYRAAQPEPAPAED